MNVFVIQDKNDAGWYIMRPLIVPDDLRGVPKPYPICCISRDLASLRQPLIGFGLTKLGRQLGDPPQVLETWM